MTHRNLFWLTIAVLCVSGMWSQLRSDYRVEPRAFVYWAIAGVLLLARGVAQWMGV